MNGFEKHGLDHSSPSQINMWAECPGAWAAKYLYGQTFHFGVAPQIGVLVEQVVAAVLLGSSLDEQIKAAEKQFLKDNALNTDEKDLERVSNIADMAALALEALKEYGEPEFNQTLTGPEQQKIELKCNGDGWQLPIIGYLDFVFPKHGLIIDLKTTLRCPSTMSDAHARQAAIYSKAKGNMGVKFLYVTPKKHNLIGLEDEAQYLNQVKHFLNRQEKLLKIFTKEDLINIVHVNSSSFYWNKDGKILKELYGL